MTGAEDRVLAGIAERRRGDTCVARSNKRAEGATIFFPGSAELQLGKPRKPPAQAGGHIPGPDSEIL